MSTQIIRRKLDVSNRQFLTRRVQRRLKRCQPIVLEHVQQRRLASIVETEEEQLGGLVPQAERGQDVLEPVLRDRKNKNGIIGGGEAEFRADRRRDEIRCI